jgi:protein-tyrosine-phosphatase
MESSERGRRRVLFVCVENSCRSQMAEGFARAHGGAKVEAVSAGSRPSGAVNERAVAFMAERGIDLSAHRSRSIEEVARGAFDAVVTMGCGDACPHVPADLRLDWDLQDPKEMDDAGFRAVRDEIERRVLELISSTA